MITLQEARLSLVNEFAELVKLEQRLEDTTCKSEQEYLVNKIVECETNIRELDEEIKLLESEE